MTDYRFEKHCVWKRIILSSLLANLFNDEKILASAFNPIRYVTTTTNVVNHRILEHHKQFLYSDDLSAKHECRRQRIFLQTNDLISDDMKSNDRTDYPSKPNYDLNLLKSRVASWSTPQLLSELNKRRIRYAPSASRNDLEKLLIQYSINSKDSSALDANTDQPQGTTNDIPVQESFLNDEPSNSVPITDLDERLQRRVRRRQQQQQQMYSDRFRERIPDVLYTMVPSVTGNVMDFTKRKARRWKRQISDFLLLDEETGIRDVIRYDYIRTKDQKNSVKALNTEVVLGPGDAIEVIIDDLPSRPFSSEVQAFRSRRRNASSSNQNSTVENCLISYDQSSPQMDDSYLSDRQKSLRRLLPSVNAYQGTSASFSTQNEIPPPKKKRRKENPSIKKVYNPYSTNGSHEVTDYSIVDDDDDDDKDVIDRVADFFTNTADQIFDRILVNDDYDDTVHGSNRNRYEMNTDQIVDDAPPSTVFNENNSKTSRSERRRTTTNNNQFSQKPRSRSSHKRHWKDRLEERLDSMLGLHENGDFYRSWTERDNELETTDNDKNYEPYDAFSVAQGRKPPPKQRRNSSNSRNAASYNHQKPFWDEDGNIFSLLFGRTKNYKSRNNTRLLSDLRLQSGGSLLSIFQFILQNVIIVASYLCRWASTQGALPQPVVVFTVGSAMLCARPPRRLFVAGITLLLLRTVGEVLHGYVYGTSGWEEGDEVDNDTTRRDKDDGNEEL